MRAKRATILLQAAAATVCGGMVGMHGTAWADITTSLIHHYTFDDTSGTTAVDSGSSPSNGTIVGTPILDAPGVQGTAFLFNGTNSYINTNSASLIPSTGAFSLFLFAATSTSLSNGVQTHLVSDNNGQTGRANLGVIDNPTSTQNAAPFWFHNGSSFSAFETTDNITDGNYHLIGVTRDASNNTILYIDNASFSAGTDTAALPTTVTWLIGAQPNTNTGSSNRSFFSGLIDDVRVYSRALSSSDVSQLLSLNAVPSTGTWSGNGAGNWNGGQDWVGNSVPDLTGAGASLIFTGSLGTSSNNDIVGAKVSGLTFDANAGSFTITGNGFTLSGLKSISNNSSNTQVFNTGTISAGFATVSATNAPIVINSTLDVGTYGTTTLRGLSTLTINGQITGSAGIDKRDTGTLILTNTSNNFTGTLTVYDGVIPVTPSNINALGSNSATLATGAGAVSGEINVSGGVTIAKPLSLASRSNQNPGIESTGNNTFTGGATLTSGGTDVTIQSDSGSLDFTNGFSNTVTGANTTLRLLGAGNGEIDGGIANAVSNTTGTISIAKDGAGTWVLAGGANNQVNGTITVLNGTLKLNGDLSAGTANVTDVTIQSGATYDVSANAAFNLGFHSTLQGKGTVQATALNIFDDNTIRPGDDSTGNVGTLTINGDVTISSFNTTNPGAFVFDLSSNNAVVGGGVNDLININGNLTFGNSNTLNMDINPTQGALSPGNYRLINYSLSKLGSGTWNIVLPGGTANYRQTFSVDDSVAGQVNLLVNGNPGNLVWRGDGSANVWDLKTTSNWLNTSSAASDTFYDGDSVTFDDTSSNQTVNVSNPVYPSAINVNGAKNYTIVGGGSLNNFSGAFVLSMNGTGNLTLTNTNVATFNTNFTGQVEINSGTVSVINLGMLSQSTAADRLIFNGGALRNIGGAGSTGRLFTLGPNGGTLDNSGTGALTLSNVGATAFTGNGARTLGLTGTFTTSANSIAATIGDGSGGATSIYKDGPSLWALNGSDSYSGTTTVNAGRLQVGNASALGSNVAGTTIATNAQVYVLLGAAVSTVAEPFTINGPGLGASDTSGALRIGNTAGTVTFSGGVTLASNSNIGVDDPTYTANISGAVTGSGGLTKTGGGVLALQNASNTYTGGTTVTVGTLHALQLSNGTLIINGGTAQLNANAVPDSAAGLTTVPDLQVPSGKLDLTNNEVVVNYASVSPAPAIRAALIAGYASGSWTGAGIQSSTAAAVAANNTLTHKTAIGYGEASAGVAVPGGDSTSLLIKYTFAGDANLDGVVNASDFDALATNYGTSSSAVWTQGDFNYDGTVNVLDFNALAANFNQVLPTSAPALGTLVPEPAGLALIAIGAAAGMRRRRVVNG